MDSGVTTSCPICGGVFREHRVDDRIYKGRKVYTYTCDECSFVGLEFHQESDVTNLKLFLSERGGSKWV